MLLVSELRLYLASAAPAALYNFDSYQQWSIQWSVKNQLNRLQVSPNSTSSTAGAATKHAFRTPLNVSTANI